MMRKRRVLVNAAASVAQVVVNGIAFLVLYRFLYDTIGIADVGIWATVLTTTSASHLANLGLSGSTVIFVSKYLARNDTDRVDGIIQTSAVSIALVMGLVLLAVYPLLAGTVIPWIIRDPAALPLALAVLPYALTSFWFTSIGNVLLSAIDGFERVDLRNALTIVSALLYLTLSFALVPQHGLMGLAYAQVAQAVLLCASGWVLLKYLFRPLPLLPFRWTAGIFREMLGYNVQFQTMSIAQMLFDPTARALIARFGGLDAAGFFEMAYKMVVQLRALVITAQYAIVPTIANLQETMPEVLADVYRKTFRLNLFLVLASLPLLLALTPVISELYLGAYEPTFVLYAGLLFAGWFLNLLSNPAYFANLGTGTLRWNVIGHLISGVLNAALGALLGWWIGGAGVVVGFVVALVAGSTATAVEYQRRQGIGVAEVFQRDSIVLGATALAGLGAAVLLHAYFAAAWSPFALLALVLVTYFALTGIPIWRHSMRQQLQYWIVHVLLTRRPSSAESRPT